MDVNGGFTATRIYLHWTAMHCTIEYMAYTWFNDKHCDWYDLLYHVYSQLVPSLCVHHRCRQPLPVYHISTLRDVSLLNQGNKWKQAWQKCNRLPEILFLLFCFVLFSCFCCFFSAIFVSLGNVMWLSNKLWVLIYI